MSARAFRLDPYHALRRSIAALIGGTVSGIADEPWASVTLDGRRHRFRIVSPARPDRLARIAEVEFDLPGYLVADIAVLDPTPGDEPATIEIEALTIAVD